MSSACRAMLPYLLCVSLLGQAAAEDPGSYKKLITPEVKHARIAQPDLLQRFVKDGALTLGLRDAILLALENNTNIRISETQIETQKFSLLAAHAPFDPLLQDAFNINRSSYSGYSQLQGVGSSGNGTFSQLTQSNQTNYVETLETGTILNVGLNGTRTSTNSSFFFYNPFYTTSLSFQFTQPLLRNFGWFPNTAPIRIAQRNLDQSRATFQAQVSDAILQTLQAYWTTVQARSSLNVNKESLALAESSYARDKRALELGALGQLDIYRSQSETAARRVQVIQGELVAAQAENALRLVIGADQDPKFQSMPLLLTEKPAPEGATAEVNPDEALAEAIKNRPEVHANEIALEADHTSVRLAHNQLRPDLSIIGLFQSNGLGGNQFDINTGQLIATGGLRSSFGQLFGFSQPTYGGTLSLNLPIRKRAAEAGLGTALVAQTRDLYTRRLTNEAITREVNDAVVQVRVAKAALEAGTASLDLSRKSLAADQRKFELGAQTNFFVLDSQTRVAESQLALLQAQISYQIAVATLHHATGNILEPYHVEIEGLMR